MLLYLKYLKYKNKYINVKNNQLGGKKSDTIKLFKERIESIDSNFNKLLKLIKKKYSIKMYRYNNFNLIIIYNKELLINNKVLFALAGISTKSFIGTSTVLLNEIEIIMTKFNAIYLLEYSSYSIDQQNACVKRDEILKNKCNCIIANIYNPELNLNINISININKLIKKLSLINIYLLGKCNGAWVAINMLLNNIDLFEGIYLGVPGIPIYNNKLIGLDQILKDNSFLKNINLKIGYRYDDGYEFLWRKKELELNNDFNNIINNEIILYKKYFGNNNVFFEKNLDDIKSKENHEITNSFIKEIISNI